MRFLRELFQRSRRRQQRYRLTTRQLARIEILESRRMLAAPNPFDLSTLDGGNGFVFNGSSSGSSFGLAVSSAGDVNGDGYDDVFVGDFLAESGDTEGEAYVMFGKAGGFSGSINADDLDGSNGFKLDPVANPRTRFGWALADAADVNGDGFDDLVVSSYQNVVNGDNDVGETYVIFGKSAPFPAAFQVGALDGTNGFKLHGAGPEDASGFQVSGAGDVNGDGFGDLAISAVGATNDGYDGEVYVVFGKESGFAADIDLGSLDGTNGFTIEGERLAGTAGHRLGNTLSAAGDFNGDGFGDLVIGANHQADNFTGRAYVLFGNGGFAARVDVQDFSGADGFALQGTDERDFFGRVVGGAGDVNGDGFDDVIVSATGADPGGRSDAGEVYVIFGTAAAMPPTLAVSALDGGNGFVVNGINDGDQIGPTFAGGVNGLGDLNADGYDDFGIGSSGADPGGVNLAGQTYIVFGRPMFTSQLELSSLDGNNGFAVNGSATRDFLSKTDAAGDINGDGFDDLIAGASGADPQGKAYVIFGGDFTGGAETQIGGDGSQTLNAVLGAAVDILIGGRGNDILISDGGDDVLRGGEGDDTLIIPDTDFSPRRLQGGNGTDTLRLDGGGLSLDLTAIADNRIVDIEVIDLTGAGADTLTLNALEVLNLSSHSNTLLVLRNSDDTVNRGSGWTQQADKMIGGDTFEVFTQGAAVIKMQIPGPPLLMATTTNGGAANQSGIAALALAFDVPVTVQQVASLTLFNHTTGMPVDLSTATLVGNGTNLVEWDLTGLALTDGRYTAELPASTTTDLLGRPLAQSQTFETHVLRGDVSGDALVNATDFVVVDQFFDPLPGTPFRAGDANGDGLVNASDFVEVDANFNPILLPLLELDFGDAPEASTSFPTTLAQDGARHVITGNTLFLGADRDAETDGQPDATASGDGADEDGVVPTGNLIIGTNVAVTVTSSDVGFVNGWVDFNQDGDWDDPGEQVFTDEAVVAGPNNLQIAVPAGATLGSTFARFRLTAAAGYSYDGLAPSGEVEDDQLTVATPPTATSSIERPTSNVQRMDNDELNFDVRRSERVWLMSTLGTNADQGLFTARVFSVFGRSLSLLSMGSRSPLRGR